MTDIAVEFVVCRVFLLCVILRVLCGLALFMLAPEIKEKT